MQPSAELKALAAEYKVKVAEGQSLVEVCNADLSHGWVEALTAAETLGSGGGEGKVVREPQIRSRRPDREPATMAKARARSRVPLRTSLLAPSSMLRVLTENSPVFSRSSFSSMGTSTSSKAVWCEQGFMVQKRRLNTSSPRSRTMRGSSIRTTCLRISQWWRTSSLI